MAAAAFPHSQGQKRTSGERPLLADTVEKSLFWRRTNFFSAAGASRERRREGPHRSPQKRSLTFVLVLQRLAAAETMKN